MNKLVTAVSLMLLLAGGNLFAAPGPFGFQGTGKTSGPNTTSDGKQIGFCLMDTDAIAASANSILKVAVHSSLPIWTNITGIPITRRATISLQIIDKTGSRSVINAADDQRIARIVARNAALPLIPAIFNFGGSQVNANSQVGQVLVGMMGNLNGPVTGFTNKPLTCGAGQSYYDFDGKLLFLNAATQVVDLSGNKVNFCMMPNVDYGPLDFTNGQNLAYDINTWTPVFHLMNYTNINQPAATTFPYAAVGLTWVRPPGSGTAADFSAAPAAHHEVQINSGDAAGTRTRFNIAAASASAAVMAKGILNLGNGANWYGSNGWQCWELKN